MNRIGVKLKLVFLYGLTIFLGVLFGACSKMVEVIPTDVDIMIGSQFAHQMEIAPAMGGKILPEKGNQELYAYLNAIKDRLLSGSSIRYKGIFPYQLKIVREDSVLNAFCVAGGFIYVYTGIIRFLENEAELAGVMAHEIAHAELRHTTLRILSQYGMGMVIALVLGGDPGFIVEIGKELLGLTFSRKDEAAADAAAVLYMHQSGYDPRAVGGFFKKMTERHMGAKIPEFLSTHPNSENRIAEIEANCKSQGYTSGELYADRYVKMKKLLN